MARERILITVKTYPTLSAKYEELVCTAGLREDGSWIRLYPVPFRKLPYDQQYKKYDWVEVNVQKRKDDFRPESYFPRGPIARISHLGTGKNKSWDARKKVILGRRYQSLELLIAEAKNKSVCTSLAVYKPMSVVDFRWEECDREWPKDKLQALRQQNLFEKRGSKFEVIRKLPYKFSYRFKDSDGRARELMIEDWEVGALYWKMLRASGGDEDLALANVRNKFLDELARTRDLYFFLGTTKQFHLKGPNPFIIVGVFYPPHTQQLSLV